MASEMAEFLWNQFLNAFEEAESELQSGTVSYFTAIKQEMETVQNRKKKICSSADSSSICRLLYDLNKAISKCRVFAHQKNSLSKNSLRFNNLTEYFFVKKMEKPLSDIKTELSDLIRDEGEQTSDPQRRKEGNASRIFGFEEHKVKYVEKLLEDDGGFKTIGIYGMGGSGKTTFVQEIYNTERVRSEFSKRIWVSLSDAVDSNEPEIGGKVVKLVLKALSYDIDGLTRNTSLNELLTILNDELKSESYLIVLDDVWIMHKTFWDSFLEVLQVNSGGALIVTSRLKEVCRRIVGEENLFHIPPLSKEDCWKIFMDTIAELDHGISAVIEKEIEESNHRPILAKIEEKFKKMDRYIWNETVPEIKEEIKDQFHGVPLAAKILAEVIHKRIILGHSHEILLESSQDEEEHVSQHGVITTTFVSSGSKNAKNIRKTITLNGGEPEILDAKRDVTMLSNDIEIYLRKRTGKGVSRRFGNRPRNVRSYRTVTLTVEKVF